MHTIAVIVAVLVMLAIAVLILALRDRRTWRKRNRGYLEKQAGRRPLSDNDFCLKAGLDSSHLAVVSAARADLAWFGLCDATRIYPEDRLSDCVLDYDDDVAMLVQKMGVVPGFKDYSFPMEDVGSIADFVRVMLRMKMETERAKTFP